MSGPVLPVMRLYGDGHNRHGRVNKLKTRPEYAVSVALLEKAEKNGAHYVRLTYLDRDVELIMTIHRCECGEVVLGGDVTCFSCKLIASLVVDRYRRGPQVQFERAERALNRLAEFLPELQAKAKG